MNIILPIGAAILAAILYLFACIFLQLFRRKPARGTDARWLAGFSASRYLPMERLLDGPDLAFVTSQPGIPKAAARRFQAERRRVFHCYLRNLTRDFDRLHMAARLLLLAAPQDRPDYAAALVREKLRFERMLFAVRWRLVLNRISGAPVDVSGLVQALETMNAQLHLQTA